MSDNLIHWEETSLISGKQKDYPTKEEFAKAISIDLFEDSSDLCPIDPNKLIDKITAGWMRYCVGNHDWWNYLGGPTWHMGRKGGRGCTRAWIYDPFDEMGNESAMECPPP